MKLMIIQYILRRLTEASTLRGIILTISSLIGARLSGDQTDSLVWIVLGLVGLVGTFLPDIIKKPKIIIDDNVDSQPSGNTVDNEYIAIPKPPYTKKEEMVESGWGDK